MPTPGIVPVIQEAQLHPQDGSLQGVQPVVPSHSYMLVLAPLPVVAHHSHLLGQVWVVRSQHPAVTVRAQVLARVEAEGRKITKRPNTASCPARPVSLTGVLDHLEA